MSTHHLLTYFSFHVVLIYTCSMMFSFPSHTPLFWWDSPPCSGLSWEWGNGSALPIFLCYTEVRTFSWWSYVGPLLTHTRQTFSPSLLIPKTLNQKKQKMIPLLLDAAELFDLHSTQPGSTRTRLTSLSSPYHPTSPYKPLSLPTNSTPPPPPPPPSKAHGIFMANMFGVAERC